MKALRILSILVLLPLAFSIDFSSVPWKIEFAKYRLWYELNLTENVSQAWIYFEVPQSIIDDIKRYCIDHNYTYCEQIYPRVYYYNQSSGEQIQIPCRWENTSIDEGIPFCLLHSYTNFTVYMENLSAGTYYFVVYYPWYFWEDFEDNALKQTISNVNQCFSDGWCVIDAYYSRYAKIVSNGWEPTPKKRLELYCYVGRIVLKREINLTVDPRYPLIFEADVLVSSDYWYRADSSIIFEFTLKDGTKKWLKLRFGGGNNYIPSGISLCNTVDVGTGHIRRDLLRDLAEYCGVHPLNVANITAIYLVNYYTTTTQIDNIKIVAGDLVNYYP